MSKKRNIDQLFQDQLGQFEATPSPEVWTKIEAQLKKENDRKVIPLWWKLGGVAAVLALLLTIGNGLFNSSSTQDAVVEDSSVTTDDNNLSKDPAIELNDDKTRFVNAEKDLSDQESKNNMVSETNGNDGNKVDHSSNTPESNKQTNPLLKAPKNKKALSTSEIATTQNKENRLNDKKTSLPGEDSDDPAGVAKGAITAAKITKEENPAKQQMKDIEIISETETGVADEEPSELKNEVENPSHKKSIFDAIEEDKKEAITDVKEEKTHSWEVTPNVGPVYYSSLNGGSSIDPAFSDNSQNGEVNFSYGVQVAYNINDRFSVRTGVNNVNVGYATGGIEIASGPASFALKTVDYSNPGRNVISAFDKGTIPNNSNDPNNPYGALNLKSTSENAEIRQSISYFEVPLEAKYVLLDNRFGINMIGGFSTLFLNSSEISVNDGSFRSVLGEANNLNSLSFSTNVGLGFDYKLSSKLRFNVEPMFKYQLNPYTDTSVDFKPYYFGIYSGLSFKF